MRLAMKLRVERILLHARDVLLLERKKWTQNVEFAKEDGDEGYLHYLETEPIAYKVENATHVCMIGAMKVALHELEETKAASDHAKTALAKVCVDPDQVMRMADWGGIKYSWGQISEFNDEGATEKGDCIEKFDEALRLVKEDAI